jgi:serine/threonine protein kinase
VPEQFGPYTVYESLGAGGMATVHRAVHRGPAGEKTVALKRLLPEFAHNEEFVQSFIREARIASQLRHVNCAQTIDLGQVDDTFFIAMELVVGSDLRRILRHTATVSGPLPVPLTVLILSQLCDALEYAHNLADETGTPMGIIHRDVSPANVLVARDGTVKLIDFGIAKASAASLATMSGQLKGKFAYMAPENLVGSIDARADLFAIGVIAHELLTARPLFAGGEDDFETLRRVRSMPIVPPSQINRTVPADLDTIVLTALARNPEERWQSAGAMRGALRNVATSARLHARPADLASWMSFSFASVEGPPPPRTRAPHESEGPAISVETDDDAPAPAKGGPGTIDDSMLGVATETTMPPSFDGQRAGDTSKEGLAPSAEPGMAPAKTLMFGSGVVPQAPTGATTPRPSTRISAVSPAVAAPPAGSGPGPAGARPSSSRAAVSPAAPMTVPTRASAPVAAVAAPTRASAPVAAVAAVAAPSSPRPAPPPAAPTARVEVPLPPPEPVAPASSEPEEPRRGLPIVLILVICAVAAGLGFLVVTLVQ